MSGNRQIINRSPVCQLQTGDLFRVFDLRIKGQSLEQVLVNDPEPLQFVVPGLCEDFQGIVSDHHQIVAKALQAILAVHVILIAKRIIVTVDPLGIVHGQVGAFVVFDLVNDLAGAHHIGGESVL